MYQSRLHATNGIVSLAFDALNGEVLEFTRESTWDNVVKNHVQQVYSLFEGILHTELGDRMFHVPRYLEIHENPQLTPTITIDQQEKSASVHLHYPAVIAGKEVVEIAADIIIDLPENSPSTKWRLTLSNHTDNEIDEVAFPTLNGMWLGETWTDDTLIFPRLAGWQIINPTEKLETKPPRINWKWQEYLYTYNLGAVFGEKDERGAYCVNSPYSGDASMLWLDLYDPNEGIGIYFTCRNENLVIKGLRVLSFGAEHPGVGLSIVHKPCQKRGVWQSEACVVALHEGDWHWAADDYRAWFESLPRPEIKHHRPKWFEKSAGLVAHYDFQYQGGGIVHTFKDIPTLYEQAKSLGFNHLLLSGWNEDGFDYGFPHYTPNHHLGTTEELKTALRTVREQGGHVAFYINSRLCNTAFPDQQDTIAHSAIMRRDGSLYIEKYGAANVSFASLCIGDPTWRQKLADTVNYLTHEIGADSMYLDQLAMAPSIKCYHPEHQEHHNNPTAWNQGCDKLLAELRDGYDDEGMALIFEGCCDIFGPGASGQLITTLLGPFVGRLPEVYKYTFPDQILVDMMNPRRNSAMRPEHVARHSTEFLHKAFVIGSYLWCYDLEWDNTWRRDPEQYERLKRIVALRKSWLEHYGQGRFTDTVGIIESPSDALVKRYDIENGVLLACASEQGLCGRQISVSWNKTTSPKATIMTMTDPKPRAYQNVLLQQTGDTCSAIITLPDDELAVVALS